MNESLVLATLVDAVIAFTLIECAGLVLYHRATGRGVAPREFFANLVSGLCLMLALRCLVRDTGSAWVAVCLLAAGLAHASDLWRRWHRGAASGRRFPA
jgi:hypothetical protein